MSLRFPSCVGHVVWAFANVRRAPQTRDSRGIYLPNYVEPVSHIAVDVSADFGLCLAETERCGFYRLAGH